MPLIARRAPALVALAFALTLAAAPRAGASSAFAQACRSADLVVEGRVAAAPDEFGLSAVTPGRAARREGPLAASLLVRLPERARAAGSSWLLFLVPDEMAGSLGAWVPVDPEDGLVALGRSGAPDDLLEAASLALDPPSDPSALGARLSGLVGRGDAPTAFALGEMLDRPDVLMSQSARLAPVLRTLLASRRVTPQTGALAVRVLGAVRSRGDDAVLVDLVASEAPPVIVDAVTEVLPALATPATAEHIEHALGGATDAATPGLLRLIGPAGARSLLPVLHEKLGASRKAVRMAALASIAELRDPSSLAPLTACASSADQDVARAARAALDALPREGAGR